MGKTVYVEMVNTSCPLLLNANHNHHTQKGMSTAESVIPKDRYALNVLYMLENVLYILFSHVSSLIFCKESFKNEIATCLCMGYTDENIPKAIFFLHHF